MHVKDSPLHDQWALILGASSGFGEATALELARAGMHIFGVHLDRRATVKNVERIVSRIQASGRKAQFFNVNAADPERRAEVISQIEARLLQEGGPAVLRVFMHSLAFGTLKTFIGESARDMMSAAQLNMTLEVMANSLVYWTQDLVSHSLLGDGSRIFAMTSAGDFKVIPSYGGISGAKAALEAYIRQLAVELAHRGVTANAIRAGVTDTPALQKILYLVGLMTRDDHNVAGSGHGQGGPYHMFDQGETACLMQYLCLARLHARARSGRKNHNCRVWFHPMKIVAALRR